MARLDFLEVEGHPSTPRVCLDEASDHGAWTWENKALLEALTRHWQVLCAKEFGPKLPFLLPLPLSAQALLAATRLPCRDMGCSRPPLLCGLFRPQAGEVAAELWVGEELLTAFPISGPSLHPHSQSLPLCLLEAFAFCCFDCLKKKNKQTKTVSSKVFFDVCSSPSPGAVRSDFDMKAQSFSDLPFCLPASPSLCGPF